MKKSGVFSSILIIMVLTAAGFVSYKALKESKRSQQIENEIESLRQEAEKIRQGNNSLQDKIAYFETQDFQEREAKEKLNFQKPNENVAIVKPVPKDENQDSEKKEVEDKVPEETEKISNYQKWWNKFFKQ
jgi:cell division protein FtsB